jgi:hypothetical protein
MGASEGEVMKPVVEKMEAQLKSWSSKIDHLTAKAQVSGVQAGFDTLMYIDELKALHAIAQSDFDELRAATNKTEPRLEARMKIAWNDLATALGNNPKPSR